MNRFARENGWSNITLNIPVSEPTPQRVQRVVSCGVDHMTLSFSLTDQWSINIMPHSLNICSTPNVMRLLVWQITPSGESDAYSYVTSMHTLLPAEKLDDMLVMVVPSEGTEEGVKQVMRDMNSLRGMSSSVAVSIVQEHVGSHVPLVCLRWTNKRASQHRHREDTPTRRAPLSRSIREEPEEEKEDDKTGRVGRVTSSGEEDHATMDSTVIVGVRQASSDPDVALGTEHLSPTSTASHEEEVISPTTWQDAHDTDGGEDV
jgi:hypothetical protein